MLESTRGQVKVQIQNVVATGDLNQALELESIIRVAPEAKYEPEKFPGLVYRLREPKTATLLFSSGKMVCTVTFTPVNGGGGRLDPYEAFSEATPTLSRRPSNDEYRMKELVGA